MKNLSCCFIGHRKVQDKELVFSCVKQIVATLVSEKGVRIFRFGSKSEFDDICHIVVTNLQSIYPDIVRVNYNLKSEYTVRKEEKAKLQQRYSQILKKDVTVKDFDEFIISHQVINAGRASYVERNQDMISDSDYCVFFYMEDYKPETNPHSPSGGKSGV